MNYPYNPYQPYTQNSLLWVSGEQEAQMYPIAPNNAVALWDRNGKAVYLKSADATGRPSLTSYDLTERISRPPDAILPEGGKTTPDYATKEDLAQAAGGIEAAIKKLQTEINKLKKEKNDE